jgi:DNA-binding XRE family transcriptional regulator
MYLKDLIGHDYTGKKSNLTAWRAEHKYSDNALDLTSWVAKENLVDDDVAKAVGCTRPYFNKVRNGMVTPNLTLAMAIWDFTRREVPIEQLLPRAYRPALAKTKKAAA